MAVAARISYFGGTSEPSDGADASGGFKFCKVDTQSGTTPITRPTGGPGATAYSWIKNLGLEATTQSTTTTIGALKAKLSQALVTGLVAFFKGNATFVNAAASALTDNTTTDDAIPGGYTAFTTSYQDYDTDTGISCTGTTPFRMGKFLQVAAGVSSVYGGGAGSSISMVASGSLTLSIQYTEV